jgi:hypothetical protein
MLTLVMAAATVFFSPPEVALSQSGEAVRATLRDPQVSDIFVPGELGYVIERHAARAGESQPTIVHIQEAHTNYEGQKNLAGILEHLIKEFGLRLILVEGGDGNASLAYLRSYGPPDNRRQVAEKYLKAGILSGEEYLDIVLDAPLILWGVEDRKLYEAHVDAFLDGDAARAAVELLVGELGGLIDALRPHLSDPTLLELNNRSRAFERKEERLTDYAAFLGSLAKSGGIPPAPYPNLLHYLTARQYELTSDRAKVAQEQQRLFEDLAGRLSEPDFDGLLAKARQMKGGSLTQQAFYEYLEAVAARAKADLASYGQLAAYITYVKESAQVDGTKLAQELDELAGRLRWALAATSSQQAFQTAAEGTDLLGKLIDVRLSPSEYERWQALRRRGSVIDWIAALKEEALKRTLPVPTPERLEELERTIPRFERFYTAAFARDEALVGRAMAKLQETGERLAVLITGGFHAKEIAAQLKARGAGLVAVAAKTTGTTDERHYRAVLRYKSGHGSLEEVFATATQAGSVAASERRNP